MEIARAADRKAGPGPADYFTGEVRHEPLISAPEPARVAASRVTFQPGARTAWHTHPLGQTLVVIEGVGRCQKMGGPIDEIRAGDVVWIPPGEKHWHGAGPDTAMTHIAIQEKENGSAVTWMEHVTDTEYRVARGAISDVSSEL